MRSKEEAHDYRYFPEPDLVPFVVDPSEIEKIRRSLPELPRVKLTRFLKDYQLNDYDANILIQDKNLAAFFEECAKIYDNKKKICNWIGADMLKEMNDRKLGITELKLSPRDLTTLIQKVEDGTLSNLAGKEVLKRMLDTGKEPGVIIQEEGMAQVSDDGALEKIIDDVIKDNENIAEQIRGGNDKAIGFLVGQGMKKSQGKGNPKKIGELIRRRLTNG